MRRMTTKTKGSKKHVGVDVEKEGSSWPCGDTLGGWWRRPGLSWVFWGSLGAFVVGPTDFWGMFGLFGRALKFFGSFLGAS